MSTDCLPLRNSRTPRGGIRRDRTSVSVRPRHGTERVRADGQRRSLYIGLSRAELRRANHIADSCKTGYGVSVLPCGRRGRTVIEASKGDDMVRIEEQATINRPIEEVFAYMSDIDRQPEWVSTLTASRKVTSGPTGVGTTFQQSSKFLGRQFDLDNEITDYEPPTVYAFHSKSGSIDMRMRFTFTATGPSTTEVNQVAEGTSGGLFKLAEPMMARSMKKQFAEDLERLKQNLESGVASQSAAP